GHAALVVSLLIAGTLAIVDSGGLVYNVRDGAAKWLLWASPLVNLTTGVPSAFQNPPVVVVRQALVWVAAVGLALWFGRLLARRGAAAATIATVTGAGVASAGMLALTIVWRTNHALPRTPETAAVHLLRRYDPTSGQIAVAFPPLR